jgi:hypothetical protein
MGNLVKMVAFRFVLTSESCVSSKNVESVMLVDSKFYVVSH